MSRYSAHEIPVPPAESAPEPADPAAGELRSLAKKARTAGHELNNLLTTILGRAQHLLSLLGDGEVEAAEIRRQLAQIEGAALGGARTVERLMLSARAVSARTVSASAPSAEIHREPRTMNILVIDDEPPVRRLLGEILRSAGHKVVETSNPRQGLRWLESEDFDLLLTDLGMPGVSGWEVARRARSFRPSLKIGVISGWGDHASELDLAENGVDFLWAKPFEVREILAALKML